MPPLFVCIVNGSEKQNIHCFLVIGAFLVLVRRANIKFAPTLASDIGWIIAVPRTLTPRTLTPRTLTLTYQRSS
jgi:hypothetical protein